MTYRKLRKILDQLTPEQLNMQVMLKIENNRINSDYDHTYLAIDNTTVNNIPLKMDEESCLVDADVEGDVLIKKNHLLLEIG